MSDIKEEMFIWEPAPIVKPEFRLYYDAAGSIVCYTCENLDGDYIVIDAQTYAEGRYDIKVLNGKIVNNFSNAVIARLTKDIEGTLCSVEDISLIIDSDEVETQYWKLKVYELG
jgi:hypothetical protein